MATTLKLNSIRRCALLCTLAALPFVAPSAMAEEQVIVNVKRLSLDTATQLAQAAIAKCREEGVQVAVTVVDRSGNTQVVLRDVLAMTLTLEISQKKAYTALSFNAATSGLEGRFEGNYAVPKVGSLIISAGGLPITAAGALLGGVGVSGAPSGITDEACAQAGIDAVMEDLEMAGF